MIKSLRWRIQIWHSIILLLAVAGLGTFLGVRLRQTTFDQIDTELLGAAHALRSAVAALPPHELSDGHVPHLPPLPRDRPPGRDERAVQMDRMLRNLALPPGFAQRYYPTPYFIAWRANGDVLRQSPDAPDLSWAARPIFFDDESPVFRRRRHYRDVYLPGPEGTTVVVGRSIRREADDLVHWVMVLIGSGTATVLLGVVGGYWLAQRALRPLVAMSAAAAQISADNLSQRLETANTDTELAVLAETLNATFDRLEASFLRQARFTADASHELRTPLTIMLGHLELSINAARARGDETASLEAAYRAARRMKTLVEELLLLARADGTRIELQTIDFAAIIEECLELLAPLARDRQVEVQSNIKPLEVEGDPGLLAQVVMNLVTNAIVHNRRGGAVQVTLTREGNAAVLGVADTGPGIPEEARPQLFERFFRADAARSRETGGSGLGLAIAQTIVKAHRGTLTFTSELDHGSTFTVRLPCDAKDVTPN